LESGVKRIRTRKKMESLLIESASAAAAIATGEAPAARQHTRMLEAPNAIVAKPPSYSAKRIRMVREDVMRVSQSVFARVLNVSPATVRGWERGARKPDGPTLRLLELAEHQPQALMRNVTRRHARAGRGQSFISP
jgi:DNA-binding transcriptional regulator YiaG